MRISFFDEVESITFFNPTTQEELGRVTEFTLFAASHYATSEETLLRASASIEAELQVRLVQFAAEDKLLEAQRLRSRTEHDLEMLRETGTCAGIENYSAHLRWPRPGERPYTLLDYFPDDFLVVIDESHVAIPQLRGRCCTGDRSKETLVDMVFASPALLITAPSTLMK